MRPPPGAIYLAALTILVAAGVLVGARQEAPDPLAAVPESCVELPADAVADAIGHAPAARDELTREGVRFGRWLGNDGEVIAELRCARPTFTELGEHRAALAGDDATVLDTTPPTLLTRIGTGTVLRQVDEDRRLSRTWFVAAELSRHEATTLVEATLRAQQVDAGA